MNTPYARLLRADSEQPTASLVLFTPYLFCLPSSVIILKQIQDVVLIQFVLCQYASL